MNWLQTNPGSLLQRIARTGVPDNFIAIPSWNHNPGRRLFRLSLDSNIQGAGNTNPVLVMTEGEGGATLIGAVIGGNNTLEISHYFHGPLVYGPFWLVNGAAIASQISSIEIIEISGEQES